MKANSNGSVTPVKKADNAAAPKRPAATFFLFSFAVWYIAKAPAGRPNIITGKNPAWYIPVTPFTPPSICPQNLPISSIPAILNQNTEFNAWCNPNGINNLLKNP